MEWYYAINGERRGPVTPEEMARLVANGTVTDDALVWRSGMANWLPWGQVNDTAGLPPPPLSPASTYVRGDDFAAAADRATAEESMDAEGFWAGVQERGYPLVIGDCLGRAWDLYKSEFGPCLGVTLVAYVIMAVAGMVPLIGLAAVFVVSPQITAGLYWYFLRRVRGEPAEIGNLFDGYRRAFGRLALASVLQVAIMLPFIVLIAGVMGAAGVTAAQTASGSPAVVLWVYPVLGLIGLASAVVMLRLNLAPFLIIDRGYSAIDAMKLSWRLMGKRFWTFVGLMLAFVLISLAGLLALFVGLLLVTPLYPAALAYAYEDAWRSARGLPSAQ